MDVREKLVELLRYADDSCFDTGCMECSHMKRGRRCKAHFYADILIANGVTVKVKKEKPPVGLTNKCGSCKHSVPAVGVFGNSTCYVRCTNKEHLSARRYQGRSLVDVRQRAAKACKKYEPRPPKGE